MERNEKENNDEINEDDATMRDEINKADTTKGVDDDECNKWWQSIQQTMLNSGGQLASLEAFGISVVPEELRKWNENAYKPKIIAIGPTFNGTRRDLLYMEAMKRTCMTMFLIRSEEPESLLDETKVTPVEGSLREFSKMIWRNDEAMRSCYTEEISLDRSKLATTMLCDCLFLLELLILSGSGEFCKKFVTLVEVLMIAPLMQMEEVLTDLLLLENQIPLGLVISLSQKLFPEEFGDDIMSFTTLNTFIDMSMSLLKCSPPPPHGGHFHYTSDTNLRSEFPVHFLELVHSSLFLGRDDDDENQRVSLPIADKDEEQVDDRLKLKLNRCATRLHAAGITIKPPQVNTDKPNPTISSLNFDIRFRDRTLEIPQLHMTEATETLWRNFIAWEHHKKKWFGKYRNALAELMGRQKADSFRCKCSSAALLFDELICCSSDVQLLKDKKVIVDHLKMSNLDVIRFFRSITMGVDSGIVDYSSRKKMVADLNTFPASNKVMRIPILGWHYLWKILEELFYTLSKFFRRRYNFAVTFGLVIGVIQTVYSVLSYHQDK